MHPRTCTRCRHDQCEVYGRPSCLESIAGIPGRNTLAHRGDTREYPGDRSIRWSLYEEPGIRLPARYQLLSKQSKIASVDDDHALTMEKDRSLRFVNSKEIEEPQIFGIHAFILSRSIATKVSGGIHPGCAISKPTKIRGPCRAANPNRQPAVLVVFLSEQSLWHFAGPRNIAASLISCITHFR